MHSSSSRFNVHLGVKNADRAHKGCLLLAAAAAAAGADDGGRVDQAAFPGVAAGQSTGRSGSGD
jgi:hypothetical protein